MQRVSLNLSEPASRLAFQEPFGVDEVIFREQTPGPTARPPTPLGRRTVTPYGARLFQEASADAAGLRSNFDGVSDLERRVRFRESDPTIVAGDQEVIDEQLLQENTDALAAETETIKQTYRISDADASLASVDSRPTQSSSARSGMLMSLASPLDQNVVPYGGPSRTINDLHGLATRSMTQILPAEAFELDIVGVPYTVIRFQGHRESQALQALESEQMARYGDRWTVEPIQLPVYECGVDSTGDEQEDLRALLAYTDALFTAYAYGITYVDALDARHAVCLLQAVSSDNVVVDAKAILKRLYSLTDPEDPESILFFVNTVETFRKYLESQGITHQRVLQTVQRLVQRALVALGFSEVAFALLNAGTYQGDEYWREELLQVLGTAESANSGLGGETVTGALVQSLMKPALRYVADEQQMQSPPMLRGTTIVDEVRVTELIGGVADLLGVLRVKQAGRTVDERTNEALFFWCCRVGPIEVQVVRHGERCGTDYADLCVAELPNGTGGKCFQPRAVLNETGAEKPAVAEMLQTVQATRNSTFHYGEIKTTQYRNPQTCEAVCTTTTTVVSGLRSFLDDWCYLILRPKTCEKQALVINTFAPSQALRSAVSPIPSDPRSPFAVRINRDQLVRALVSQPQAYEQMRPVGIFEGHAYIGQL